MADCLTLLRLLDTSIFRRGVTYHRTWKGEGAKYLSSLPLEIWLHITSFLDPWSSLVCLGCTSIEFRCIALQHFASQQIRELFFIKHSSSEMKYQSICKSLVIIREFIERPMTQMGVLISRSFLHVYGSLSSDKVLTLLDNVSLYEQKLFIPCRYAKVPERFILTCLQTLYIMRQRSGVQALLYAVKDRFKELNIDVQFHDTWKYMTELGKKEFLERKEDERKRKRNVSTRHRQYSKRLVKKMYRPIPLEITNITSHERIGHSIDITRFYNEYVRSGKVEYDPIEFKAAIVKDVSGTALVFETGSIVYTGQKSMEVMEIARQTVHEMIQPFIIHENDS